MKIKSGSSKRILIIVSCLVLLVGAVLLYVVPKLISNSDKATGGEIAAGSKRDIQNKVDLSPPTAEQKIDGENTKIDNIENSQPLPNGSNGKKIVSPAITRASVDGGVVIAKGYVSNITENDGSCTYNFTKGSLTKTKVVTGRADATTTICPTVSFSQNELGAGDWTVFLTYNSTNYDGKSDAQTLRIQ